MSEYNQLTTFTTKDALAPGDPDKAALGADVDAELDAIATAVASKLDIDFGNGLVVGATYTPSSSAGVTAVTNVDAATPDQAHYIRIGTTVIVFGRVAVNPTLASATVVGISLPVASNLALAANLHGLATAVSAAENAGYLEADPTNDKALLKFTAVSTSSVDWLYSFAYKVI